MVSLIQTSEELAGNRRGEEVIAPSSPWNAIKRPVTGDVISRWVRDRGM
jgi:hypothetical protein